MWALIAALVLVLAGIGATLDLGLWPSGHPAVLVPLLSAVYAGPTVLVFTADSGQ